MSIFETVSELLSRAYHGTKENFSSFDDKFIGTRNDAFNRGASLGLDGPLEGRESGGDAGWGVYFTPGKIHAGMYAVQIFEGEPESGYILTVEITVPIESFIDFGKRLDAQPVVLNTLRKYFANVDSKLSGGSFYWKLADRLGSAKRASLLLDRFGIHGSLFDDTGLEICVFNLKNIQIMDSEEVANRTQVRSLPDEDILKYRG